MEEPEENEGHTKQMRLGCQNEWDQRAEQMRLGCRSKWDRRAELRQVCSQASFSSRDVDAQLQTNKRDECKALVEPSSGLLTLSLCGTQCTKDGGACSLVPAEQDSSPHTPWPSTPVSTLGNIPWPPTPVSTLGSSSPDDAPNGGGGTGPNGSCNSIYGSRLHCQATAAQATLDSHAQVATLDSHAQVATLDSHAQVATLYSHALVGTLDSHAQAASRAQDSNGQVALGLPEALGAKDAHILPGAGESACTHVPNIESMRPGSKCSTKKKLVMDSGSGPSSTQGMAATQTITSHVPYMEPRAEAESHGVWNHRAAAHEQALGEREQFLENLDFTGDELASTNHSHHRSVDADVGQCGLGSKVSGSSPWKPSTACSLYIPDIHSATQDGTGALYSNWRWRCNGGVLQAEPFEGPQSNCSVARVQKGLERVELSWLSLALPGSASAGQRCPPVLNGPPR